MWGSSLLLLFILFILYHLYSIIFLYLLWEKRGRGSLRKGTIWTLSSQRRGSKRPIALKRSSKEKAKKNNPRLMNRLKSLIAMKEVKKSLIMTKTSIYLTKDQEFSIKMKGVLHHLKIIISNLNWVTSKNLMKVTKKWRPNTSRILRNTTYTKIRWNSLARK